MTLEFSIQLFKRTYRSVGNRVEYAVDFFGRLNADNDRDPLDNDQNVKMRDAQRFSK